jgi:hypothetical protein
MTVTEALARGNRELGEWRSDATISRIIEEERKPAKRRGLGPARGLGRTLNQDLPGSGAPRTPRLRAQVGCCVREHLLVVPVGSTVDFLNRDLYFRSVFSVARGKPFDLGLYHGGSKKRCALTASVPRMSSASCIRT